MMRMRTPVIAAFVVLTSASAVQATTATPAILMTKANKVPACTTPERLMAFVGGRNKAVPPKLHEIAADYKRHGEELQVRWDYAFFQMIVETNWLKFYAPGGKPGDVSPGQNNFAGLGATGHRAPGESFASVDRGVLAHLQHVRLYSGDPVENPVAERTKLVTDLILPWAQSLKRPVTFTDLTRKWAPSGHSYSDAIENVASIFRAGYCTGKATDVPADETAKADTAGADAEVAAAEHAAQPVAKAKGAAKTLVKMEAAAVDSDADTPDAPAVDVAEASDAPALAGPAMKKIAAKPATAKLVANMPNVNRGGISDAADEAPATETAGATPAKPAAAAPAAKGLADKVPAQTQPAIKTAAAKAVVIIPPKAESVAQAEDTVDVVSPAAGKVVSSAKAPAKLAVAATVTKPQAELVAEADASQAGTTQAETTASVEGGEGGGTEASPPEIPAKKAATVVAASAVKKALVAASADSLPAVKASAPAAVETTAESAETVVAATTETTSEDATKNTQLASLTVPANPVPGKNCKVFTASYGGGKSVLIKSLEGDRTRFTALTVNEAKAETQAKAFINVYAKGGQKIAEFGTQNEALTQAFQLCPEG